MIQDGIIGPVTHAVIHFGGSTYLRSEPPSTSPADEAWQRPAPRHPYSPTHQRNWRAFYDYGGGLVTDWGVHLVNTARSCLGVNNTDAPLLSSASAHYLNVETPDREQVPNAFVCSWQCEKFLISFTNAVMPDPDLLVPGGTPFFSSDAQGGDYFVSPIKSRSGTTKDKPRRCEDEKRSCVRGVRSCRRYRMRP